MNYLQILISNKKRQCCLLLALLLLMSAVWMVPLEAQAASATDSLSVRVGYQGMSYADYVEVGDYSWSELMDYLGYYEENFSYFRQGYTPTEYTAIVDSARGFSVASLLDLSNVYHGDIYNITFYAQQDGYQKSMDYGTLFRTRYYYDDVAGHRKEITEDYEEVVPDTYEEAEVLDDPDAPEFIEVEVSVPVERYIYDSETGEQLFDENGQPLTETVYETQYEQQPNPDYGKTHIEEVPVTIIRKKVVGYDFSEAEGFKYAVAPMLAFEDSWASYTEEFENIGPNFSSLNAGNRFRLLYGQTSPTEKNTDSSVKCVRIVYITLLGKPVYGEAEPITGKIGTKGTTTIRVNVSNLTLRDGLSSYALFTSTDESVLKITGTEVKAGDNNDIAYVTISYEITGSGSASIVAGIAGVADSFTTIPNSTIDNTEETNPKKDPEDTQKDQNEEGGKKDSSVDKDSASDGQNKDEQQKESTSEESEELSEEEAADMSVNQVYQVPDEMEAMISDWLEAGRVRTTDEEISTLVVEDHSEEEAERQRRLLILTGLGCAMLCGVGAAGEVLVFKYRLVR